MDHRFTVKLRRPADLQGDNFWAFIILPKSESDRLARRGRTSVQGTIDGHLLTATVEPDGQLSHWLKVPQSLLDDMGIAVGSTITVEICPCAQELEPTLPPEFADLLNASPQARATWEATTTIARIDWIHWIESAKQAPTRLRRTTDACHMLAAGNKRVCCFDSSGYYSKSLRAPREAQ